MPDLHHSQVRQESANHPKPTRGPSVNPRAYAHGRDGADNLVSGNHKGYCLIPHLLSNYSKITVTQPAVFYLDLNLVVSQGAGAKVRNGSSAPPGLMAA